MHRGLELVHNANTKSLEFDTSTNHVPRMQRSSHLGLGTCRVIWMRLAGGTSRRMRTMKMRTVTPVLLSMRTHLLGRRPSQQEHRRHRTCHQIMQNRRLWRSTWGGCWVQLHHAIPCPNAWVIRNLKMLNLQKYRPQICLMTYSNRLQQSKGPQRIAAGTLWKPRRRTIIALCATAFC